MEPPTGVLVPLSTSKFQNLVSRAEEGDSDAQYSLAELYCRGDGVPRNYVEAEKWYLLSAKQGHPGAQYGLGVLYLKHLGNRAEGTRLLTLAGERGDSDACYALATTLSQASGQGRDPVAAYAWFCLVEAYDNGPDCGKEISKLESELSVEQILGAQLRAREAFRPAIACSAADKAEAAARSANEEANAELERRHEAERAEDTALGPLLPGESRVRRRMRVDLSKAVSPD